MQRGWVERQDVKRVGTVTAISTAEFTRRDFVFVATAAAAGRIRQGPAPLNLALPLYQSISATELRIGDTTSGQA